MTFYFVFQGFGKGDEPAVNGIAIGDSQESNLVYADNANPEEDEPALDSISHQSPRSCLKSNPLQQKSRAHCHTNSASEVSLKIRKPKSPKRKNSITLFNASKLISSSMELNNKQQQVSVQQGNSSSSISGSSMSSSQTYPGTGDQLGGQGTGTPLQQQQVPPQQQQAGGGVSAAALGIPPASAQARLRQAKKDRMKQLKGEIFGL